MISVLAINSYDITGKKQIIRLGAVSSTINHSCDPNLIATHEGNVETNTLNFIAKTDIKKGDQLFVSYVNPELSKKVCFMDSVCLLLKERQEGLTMYGFTCNCTRCKAESTEEEKVEKKEDSLEAKATNHQTPLSQHSL